jgi:FKBP-type peptidyl-prolyl cis-trans isomerase
VGTDKRERQKSARQLKIEAEQRAAVRTRRKRTAVRLAVTAVVVVAGLLAYSILLADDDDDDETAAADETSTTVADDATTTSAPEILCDNPDVAAAVGRDAPETEAPPEDTAADAVEVTTLVEGQGEPAAEGDSVVVHYVGRDAGGTIIDCSWQESRAGEPFTVEPLGQAGVIDGWNEGLVGVRAGERRRMVIGADKAYGDGPLAFEVDVVEIIPAG